MELRNGIFKVNFEIDQQRFTQVLPAISNELIKHLPIHTVSQMQFQLVNMLPSTGMAHKFTNVRQSITVNLSPIEFTVTFNNQEEFDSIFVTVKELLKSFIDDNSVSVVRFGFRKIVSFNKRVEIFEGLKEIYPNHCDDSYNTTMTNEYSYETYRIKAHMYYENKFIPAKYSTFKEYDLICDIDGVSSIVFSKYVDLREIYHKVDDFMNEVFKNIEG